MSRYARKMTPEGSITKSIRDLLRTLGIFHWKQFQSLGSPPGIPDIIGIYQGIPLFLEIKTSIGKLSVYQKGFLANVNLHGGLGVVLRNIDDAIELINGLKNGKDLSDLRQRFQS